MKDYRHILLAADFSEASETVAMKAKGLAKKYGAELSIVHVLDNIPMPDTQYGTVIALETDSGYDLLEAEKNQLKQLGKALGVETAKQWLIWGVPTQEIYRLARQEAVDLIVVGSHGRHGLALLMGSTADGILHHAHCDVLAVRISG